MPGRIGLVLAVAVAASVSAPASGQSPVTNYDFGEHGKASIYQAGNAQPEVIVDGFKSKVTLGRLRNAKLEILVRSPLGVVGAVSGTRQMGRILCQHAYTHFVVYAHDDTTIMPSDECRGPATFRPVFGGFVTTWPGRTAILQVFRLNTPYQPGIETQPVFGHRDGKGWIGYRRPYAMPEAVAPLAPGPGWEAPRWRHDRASYTMLLHADRENMLPYSDARVPPRLDPEAFRLPDAKPSGASRPSRPPVVLALE
jgi:hypothetical protein